MDRHLINQEATLGGNWLICIFSYNRPVLLRNLLESINMFYPELPVALFDDGSDDPELLPLLGELQSAGHYVSVNARDSRESKHGGLYLLMNQAYRYAADQGFDYAYFVQDDMQFLWRDEQLPQRVMKAFDRPECLMCNLNFLQKILTRGIEDRLPAGPDQELFLFAGNGCADTGIIAIRKAVLAGFSFTENSERGNGQYWYAKGYRLYWLPVCHLAWTPGPLSFRDKVLQGGKAYTLKPLPATAIERIQQNKTYAYLEDYTATRQYLLKPYWFTVNPGRINLLKIYIRYYLQHWAGNK